MKNQGKHFSIIFCLIIFYLTYLLIKPFLGTLIAAGVISYIIYPFFEKINSKIKHRNISIFLMGLIIILIFLIPLTFIIYSLVDDIANFYQFLISFDVTRITFLESETLAAINTYIMESAKSIASNILGSLSRYASTMTEKFFTIIIFILAVFFFLNEGLNIVKTVKKIIPLEEIQKNQLFAEFETVTKGLFHSILVSSVFSGVVGTIIFYLFGIPNALMWGLLAGIMAPIPIIANTPVWYGITLYLVLSGQYILGALMFGITLLITNLENLLIMKVMRTKSKMSSLLALLGILGGLKVFGFIGLFMGPLILSLFLTMIKFYTKNYKKEFNF